MWHLAPNPSARGRASYNHRPCRSGAPAAIDAGGHTAPPEQKIRLHRAVGAALKETAHCSGKQLHQ